MIKNTNRHLCERLQAIDDKLQAFQPNGLTISDEIATERRLIREERDSLQRLGIDAQDSMQALQTRSNILDHASIAEDATQVVITTRGDFISAKNDVVTWDRARMWFGQMSDASMKQLAVDAGDDSSLGRLSEHSRASSVTSLADSVFSITSRSSKSSVGGPTGAGERLVELLLSDDHLSVLYQEALKRVTADKFERNLRRILKRFAIDLRREAENPEQMSIAHFMRSQVRNSAHAIRNSCCSPGKIRDGITPKFKMIHEPVNMEPDDSDDDDYGPEPEDDTDLQQSEDFIITSQAFINLRHNLTSFIYPIYDERTDDEGTQAPRKQDNSQSI